MRWLQCQDLSDAEHVTSDDSCQKHLLSQLTRQAGVEESGCSCYCLARRHSEHTFTCSKLEESLAEIGSESRVCRCQYCLFSPVSLKN